MVTRKRFAWAVRCSVVVLVVVVAAGFAAAAKKSKAQSGAKNGAGEETTGSSGNPKPGEPGFSIETEMFTYGAMDAEGAVLACNIAQNLGAADQKCASKGAMSNSPGVVVIGGDSDVMDEFQLWRGDISTMDILIGTSKSLLPEGGPARPSFYRDGDCSLRARRSGSPRLCLPPRQSRLRCRETFSIRR